jgi:hypothetical protein
MKALSASEAVWPAVERTVACLFRPFKWWTYFKLSAVAVVTEGTLVSFRYSLPKIVPPDPDANAGWLPQLKPEYLPVTILAGIAALVTGLLLFVLLMQLRFAFFRCLLDQSTKIWPAWRVCRAQAERFSRASLMVWLALLLMVILFMAAVAVLVFVVFTARTPEGQLDPGVFLILFFPCVGFAALVFAAAVVAEVVMHDFILPRMALEDVSFSEAWARVKVEIRADKETFFSYFILRLLLPFLAGVVLVIATAILLPVVFGIVGMSAAGYIKLVNQGTSAGEILYSTAGMGVVVAVILGGPIGIFLRSYALVFYAGRYKTLGVVLHPAPVRNAVGQPTEAR